MVWPRAGCNLEVTWLRLGLACDLWRGQEKESTLSGWVTFCERDLRFRQIIKKSPTKFDQITGILILGHALALCLDALNNHLATISCTSKPQKPAHNTPHMQRAITCLHPPTTDTLQTFAELPFPARAACNL